MCGGVYPTEGDSGTIDEVEFAASVVQFSHRIRGSPELGSSPL
jgi:hypothetical protein